MKGQHHEDHLSTTHVELSTDRGIKMSTSYCTCTHCWFDMARSALEPQQFIARAERQELSYDQRKIVDRIKLQIWNASVKGEKAG